MEKKFDSTRRVFRRAPYERRQAHYAAAAAEGMARPGNASPVQVISSLMVKVDTSEIDVALAKAEQLKVASTAALKDLSAARNKEKIVDVLCQMAVSGTPSHRLTEVSSGLAAAIAAINL